MSQAHPPQAPSTNNIVWTDPLRERLFNLWLAKLTTQHELDTGSVRLASADASFRRYFRIQGQGRSLIIMDA